MALTHIETRERDLRRRWRLLRLDDGNPVDLLESLAVRDHKLPDEERRDVRPPEQLPYADVLIDGEGPDAIRDARGLGPAMMTATALVY